MKRFWILLLTFLLIGSLTACKGQTQTACQHEEGPWIVDTEATCDTVGSKHKECTVCHEELMREEIPGAHTVEDDGDCTTALLCSVCGEVQVAAQKEHNYTDNLDVDCNNEGCKVTRTVNAEKVLLFSDNFDEQTTPTEAGWNADTNSTIQNGTLNITHTAAEGNTRIFHTFDQASSVIVEFDFTLNYTGADKQSHAIIRLRSNDTDVISLVVQRSRIRSEEWVSYDGKLNSAVLTSGTAHKMKIVADVAKDTYFVFIDDVLLIDNAQIPRTITAFDAIMLGAQGNNSGTTGITVSYDNLFVYSGGTECDHHPSEWIVDDAATCVKDGSKYQECVLCHTELKRESVTNGPHGIKSDSNCLTADYCSLCGKLQVAAKTEHKYSDDFDSTCDNSYCNATRPLAGGKVVLYRDSFDKNTTPKNAGWNSNNNATIKDGTLNVTHMAASGNTAIFHGFEAASQITVEFDFSLNYEGNDDTSHAFIRLRDSGTNVLALVVQRHQMKSDNWVSYDGKLDSAILNAGTTHRMKIVIDTDTDTYHVLIDNVLLLGGAELKSDAASINQIVVGAQGNGSGVTGITVSYDNMLVYYSGTECDHIPGGWIIETPANCVTAGSKHQECVICQEELGREVIPAGEHAAEDDGDCTTAAYCSGCGTLVIAAQAEHTYSDATDETCDNAGCTVTREVEKTLLADDFDTNMAPMDAGWNNNTNASIENGTLNITHTAASGNTQIYHGFESKAKVTVEFDFTLNYEGEDDVSHGIIRLRNNGTNLLALVVQRHQMKINSTWVTYGKTWASGTTHTMKLVANANTGTCDVYVDGVLLKDNMALTGNANSINQLVLGAQGNGSGTTGITVSYDNLFVYSGGVECDHIPGEWIIETPASCVTEGSQYQKCTICQAELNRETIPAGEHAAEDDGDCTTAAYCSGCGTLMIAAQEAHTYTDELDATCDNAGCTATRETGKTLLLQDNFNTDMSLTDAGWNNSANAKIQNGTLNITHTAASGNTAIYHGFENASNVSIEFDFTLNYEGEDDVSHAMVRIRNSGTNLLVLVVRRHQMKINSTWINYGETWASGTTHTMKIVADADTDTCDVYVDGILLQENVALTGNANSINQLVLGAQGNGSGTTGITVAYDNLLIYQQESE